MFDVELLEGVHNKTAWATARQRDDVDAARLARTCAAIHSSTASEADRVRALFTDGVIRVEPLPSGQIHAIDVRVPNRGTARGVVDTLIADGYLSWTQLEGGAAASFFATRSSLSLVRLDDPAFTVTVHWPLSKMIDLLPKVLLPSQSDWSLVELPPKASFGYFAVRPIRLALDRLGKTPVSSNVLGPILATPSSVIDPLFDFARVDVDDHLVDLGCGDGRLVIEAASRRGCHATGVENDPTLAARARRSVHEAGVGQLVSIVEGDAADFDLRHATVVVMFIPVENIGPTVRSLRSRGFTGRIVAHEQEPLPDDLTPIDSCLLVADEAITVAHLF